MSDRSVSEKRVRVVVTINREDAFRAIRDDLGICEECNIVFLKIRKDKRFCCGRHASRYSMRQKRKQ